MYTATMSRRPILQPTRVPLAVVALVALIAVVVYVVTSRETQLAERGAGGAPAVGEASFDSLPSDAHGGAVRAADLAADAGESGAARSAVAGVVEVRVAPAVGAVRLTSPRFLVRDVATNESWALSETEALAFDGSQVREVVVESELAEWSATPDRLTIDPKRPGALTVTAEPAHRTLVTVRDAETRKPISAFDLAVAWRWIQGCCPVNEGIETVRVDSQDGMVLLEGVPLRASELRVDAATPRHFPGSSGWTEIRADGWLEIEVELTPTATHTAALRVQAIDEAGGRLLDNISATVFEESPENPIVGLLMGPVGMQPLLHTADEDELRAPPLTRRAAAEQALDFELRAPGRYRVAVRAPGRAEVLSDAVELLPGTTRSLEVVLRSGASIFGQLLFDVGDPALAHVVRFGAVQLEHAGTLKHAVVQHDGSFRFEGLAAGEHRLSAEAVVALATGSEGTIPMATRRVELAPNEHVFVEIPLGSRAPGTILSGVVSIAEEPHRWGWLAALIPDNEGTSTEAREQSVVVPSQLVSTDASGWIEFSGVLPGAYVVAAMGQREDQLAIAFAYTRVVVGDDGGASAPFELAPAGASVRLVRADPTAVQRLVTLDFQCDDPVLQLVVSQMPPLRVHGAGASVYHGLPQGDVRLVVDGELMGEEPIDRTLDIVIR